MDTLTTQDITNRVLMMAQRRDCPRNVVFVAAEFVYEASKDSSLFYSLWGANITHPVGYALSYVSRLYNNPPYVDVNPTEIISLIRKGASSAGLRVLEADTCEDLEATVRSTRPHIVVSTTEATARYLSTAVSLNQLRVPVTVCVLSTQNGTQRKKARALVATVALVAKAWAHSWTIRKHKHLSR